MRNRRMVFLIVPLLASACAVGPDYERPRPPTAAGGPFVTKAAAFDPSAQLPDNWWHLYRDPALDALVERALVANSDLRVAAANLARARAVLGEARTARLPSTSFNGGVAYGDGAQGPGQTGGAGNGGDAQWSQSAGVSLAWEVDLFGRVSRAVAAARADSEAVEAARDAVRVTVAAETTRAYVNACSYAYSIDVARKSFTTSNESLRLVTARRQTGSVSQLDVERAAATAATARSAIPALEGQRQVALFELAALLGTTPSDVPEAARSCSQVPAPSISIPVGDGTALLRRRPDLRQAERQLAADTARIGVATADLYPKISLGGEGNFFRNDGVRGGDSVSFSLGPLISWSFPNIAVARARIRQAQAQGDASLATFDGRVLNALKEVEQALAMVSTEQDRLHSLREAELRAGEAHRLADLRYRAGSIGYLDVLVAQADLLSARDAHAASERRLASAQVDLFKALGGGWQQSQELGQARPPLAGRIEPSAEGTEW